MFFYFIVGRGSKKIWWMVLMIVIIIDYLGENIEKRFLKRFFNYYFKSNLLLLKWWNW